MNDTMKKIPEKYIHTALIIGTVIFALGIVITNFTGRQWYNFDMYSDLLVARFMSESKSIFPKNWIFGNQYYVIATPVLSALIYSLIGNSFYSMAAASSIYYIAILAVLYWGLKPFTCKKSLLTAIFCMSGAIIIGESASSDIYGMQVLYTMASYYACYLFVMILTLCVAARIYKGIKVNGLLYTICFLLSFALGMQSLREMLILYIPLLILSGIFFFIYKENVCVKKTFLFAILTFVFNMAGYFVMKAADIGSVEITSGVSLTLNLDEIFQNIKDNAKNIAEISGMRFLGRGIKWMPLSIVSFVNWISVITAVTLVVARKDYKKGLGIIFCTLSILCVFGVGVFLFKTRAIYYFTWFLLVTFSYAYMAETHSTGNYEVTALLVCGCLVFFYNFYPDICKYRELHEFYAEICEDIKADGREIVYTDIETQPVVGAFSDDIICGTVACDFNLESGHYMVPVATLKPISLFVSIDPEKSYLMMSSGIYGSDSSIDYVNWGEMNIEKLFSGKSVL